MLYRVLIGACNLMLPNPGLQVLATFQARGFELDLVLITELIKLCGIAGDVDQAMTIYDMMLELGLKPVFTYSWLGLDFRRFPRAIHARCVQPCARPRTHRPPPLPPPHVRFAMLCAQISPAGQGAEPGVDQIVWDRPG